jgi:hypothetical protein
VVNVAEPEPVVQEAVSETVQEAPVVVQDVQVSEPEVVSPAVVTQPEEAKEPVEVKLV